MDRDARRLPRAHDDSLAELEIVGTLDPPKCADTADGALVDRAAAHIRSVLTKTVARGIEEVGEYLLKNFYRNDPSLFRSWGGRNHASLRLLEERCESLDLPVSRTFLSNALRMAVTMKTLPANSRFLELPASHRVELLKVKNTDKLEHLAERAVEGKFTVRKLRSVVAREKRKSKSTRGRRPTPPVLLAVAHCVRKLRDSGTGRLAFRRDDVSPLSERHRAELTELHDSLRKRVEELGKLLA